MAGDTKSHSMSEVKQNSVVLQLETGKLQSTDPKNSHSVCQINSSQLKDLPATETLIIEASKQEVRTAMIFTPFVPAFHYSAFLEGKNILLKKGDSTLKTRAGDDAQKLINEIDLICKGSIKHNNDSSNIPSIKRGVK